MKRSKTSPTLAVIFACVAFTLSLAVSAQAQTVTFSDLSGIGIGGTGWEPYGTVTQATDGNFYGTATNGIFGGGGNIFRMTPDGQITNFYTFVCSRTKCPYGAAPQTAPILGTDGNLYGVTSAGGNAPCAGGVFYRLTLQGKLSVLYNFGKTCSDGQWPQGITLGSDGNFYGATVYGGNSSDSPGIIFKVTPSGEYTELYSFCSQANCADGEKPFSPPVEGDDGNFYGAANNGGTMGGGVIYKVTASGAYSVIYNFCNLENGACPDGAYPYAIAKDADGNFVGTADGGTSGYGVVFKITPNGKYSALYSFSNIGMFGWPGSQLTLANDRNLYGTFVGGGSGSWDGKLLGAIYRISSNGDFTPLHAFCQCGAGKGFNPIAGVFQGTDGNLYGTTAFGGIGPDTDEDWGYGTVFQYASGLGPIVETVPTAAKAGKQVLILGNHLSGTTSVTFNGMPADFTVESDTYIKATVPTGATSGAVSVTTPTGTLNSSPQFVVTR
jgi:uncharacterized repeat protein (TIGR03803 family)